MRFALEYIQWHYYEGLLGIYNITRNFLWFFYEFFSIPLLLKTLFQPFHRLDERYAKGMQIEQWAQTFIINTLMRLVGAFLRIILVVLGIFSLVLTTVVGLFFLIVWALSPLLLTFLVLYGLKLVSIT